MEPLYLRMHNFLSYEDAELDWRVIRAACIQGANGAGKSALADAILFALFGETSRGRSDDIVKLGKTEMTVVYDFEQAGQSCRIVRKKTTTGRGKNVVELFAMGSNGSSGQWVPVATGDEAKKRILQIIGRNFKTFTSSSFLLQGQGERLITAKPSERYRVVFDIMGLDVYCEYRKRVAKQRNQLEGQLEVVMKNIMAFSEKAQHLEVFRKGKEEAESQLKEAAGCIEKQEAVLAVKRADLAVISNKVAELHNVLKEVEELEKQKEKLIVEKYALEHSFENLPSGILEQVNQRLAELPSDDSGLQQAITEQAGMEAKLEGARELEKTLSDLVQRKNALLQQVKETADHVQKYRKIFSNREKILQLLEEEKTGNRRIQGLNVQTENLQKEAEQINKDLRKVSELETATAGLQALLSKKEKDREASLKIVRHKLVAAEKEAGMLEQTTCKGEGQYAECPLIKKAVESKQNLPGLKAETEVLSRSVEYDETQKIEEIRKQIEALDAPKLKIRLKNIEQEMTAAKDEVASLRRRLDVISTWTKQASEIDNAEAEIRRADAAVKSVTEELEGVKKKITEIEKQKEELVRLEARIVVAKAVVERFKAFSELRRLQADINRLDKEISQAKNKAGTLEEFKKSIRALETEVEVLTVQLKTLKEQEQAALKEISRLETEVMKCRSAEAEGKKAGKESEDLKLQVKVCEILEEAYEKIPFYILDNVIEIMEEEANKVLEEISSTGMRLEFKTEKSNKSNSNVKDTLDIIVSDIAGERPIELYSGGENTRQILAIAVGLAELSARKAGVKVNTLFIDEPAGLDKQGLVDFGRMFIKLVEAGMFKKGIMMAHEEVLKDIFEQKILVTKEGTCSRVEVLV
ncbi:MAG: SMC family ATPase [Deferribacteres bacterium]|nr:SMC family ATPase [Deferribacteres bacterium]